MKRLRTFARRIALAAACLLPLAALDGCEEFDDAPKASLVGEQQTRMTTDPADPLVVAFSEPIVGTSLRVKLLELRRGDLDGELDLPDEQDPPDLERMKERTLLAYDGAAPNDPARTYGGVFELAPDRRSFTLSPQSYDPDFDEVKDRDLAVGAAYMLLVEPGLKDDAGNDTVPRTHIPFTFPLAGGGPTTLPSGYYFFLMDLDLLAQQLQLYAHLVVDPVTGDWQGIYTDADRSTSQRPGCPVCPAETPACQLLNPALDRCVLVSDKMTALEQFPDHVPVPELPGGYIFRVNGFARDETDGTIAFGTAPFDIDIRIGSGGVRIQATRTVITGSFRRGTVSGVERWVAVGSAAVDAVLINGVPSGTAEGTLSAIDLTTPEVEAVEALGQPIPTVDSDF